MKYNCVWVVIKSCLKLNGSNIVFVLSILTSFNEVLEPFPVSFTAADPIAAPLSISESTSALIFHWRFVQTSPFVLSVGAKFGIGLLRFEIEARSWVSDGVKLICESAKCLCVCQGRRQLCAGVCGDLWYAAGSHVQVQRTEVTERGVCLSQSHDPAQLQWVFFSVKVLWNVKAFLPLVLLKQMYLYYKKY